MNRLFAEHARRRVTSLSGEWQFCTDPQDVGEAQGWQNGLTDGKTVIVPSVWNNELGHMCYDGAGWYEKKFYTEGGTLRFEFESVMTKADVWLDGNKIGEHYGAFSQFEFIVNDVSAGEHTLVVRADSRFDSQSIPQKKVDWYNYGGIARDVQVDILCGISILSNRVKYTLSDDLKNASVSSELELYNAEDTRVSSGVSVRVGENEIYVGIVTLEPHEKRTVVTTPYEMKGVSLWSIEAPTLYTVTAQTDTDDLIDKIGFRRIEVKDMKICLNGKAVDFYGVNRHEEHPDWGFAFPPKLMKRDIDLVLDLGCNTIRGSHYPQSRMLLDMLDERGVLFWSEIPIWGGGFPDTVLTDPAVVERGLMMHREMTKYYYNHPSIVIWGMHNEIYTPYPCVEEITKSYAAHLKADGGNRLVTHAAAFPFENDSFEYDDIICINMYKGWYTGDFSEWDKFVSDFDEHRRKIGQDNKPVIMSEFGAGAIYGYHDHFNRVRWSEEYQSDLLKYCLELFHKTDYIVGYYIWQFCNIRTSPVMNINRVRCFNNKGIVDEYRNPKLAYFTVKELNKKFKEENSK